MTRRSCDICDMEARVYGPGNIAYCGPHYDALEEWNRAVDASLTTDAGGPWPQTCPRRMTEWGPWQREEGQDEWAIRHGYKRCSFCGSLHPDDFMAKLADGAELSTTSKTYKAYIGEDHTKFYFQHLSIEQQEAFVALYNDRRIVFAGGFGFNPLPSFMRFPGPK